MARLNALFKKDASEFDYKYKCDIGDVATKVQQMKPYLISIACFKKDLARPPPHLERHQAFLLLGYGKKFNELETKLLAGDLFAPEVKGEVLNEVKLIFKGKDYGKTYDYLRDEATTQELFNFDSLSSHIMNKYKYVQSVLFYEALTKMIMNRESCDYKTATAMALGKDIPCSTPYGKHWEELIETISSKPSKRITRSNAKTKKLP